MKSHIESFFYLNLETMSSDDVDLHDEIRYQCKNKFWTPKQWRTSVLFLDIGNVFSSFQLKLCIIIVSIVINALFYRSLPSKYSPLIKSYIVSTVHAIVSVLSVLHHFRRYNVNLKQMNRLLGGGVHGTGDEWMFYSVCYSSGYLIYDFLLMLIDKSVRTGSALIHHILILLSFCSGKPWRSLLLRWERT